MKVLWNCTKQYWDSSQCTNSYAALFDSYTCNKKFSSLQATLNFKCKKVYHLKQWHYLFWGCRSKGLLHQFNSSQEIFHWLLTNSYLTHVHVFAVTNLWLELYGSPKQLVIRVKVINSINASKPTSDKKHVNNSFRHQITQILFKSKTQT